MKLSEIGTSLHQYEKFCINVGKGMRFTYIESKIRFVVNSLIKEPELLRLFEYTEIEKDKLYLVLKSARYKTDIKEQFIKEIITQNINEFNGYWEIEFDNGLNDDYDF